MRNPKDFSYGVRNLGLWNPEYILRNPDPHIRMVSGLHVPLIKKQESGSWKSGIPGVESRVQNSLTFLLNQHIN